MSQKERFDKFDSELCEFELIAVKRSNRPDVHAFIMLDELFPDTKNNDLICGAEHDIFCLDISDEQIASLTDEQILELSRAGVHYSSEFNCLAMFC